MADILNWKNSTLHMKKLKTYGVSECIWVPSRMNVDNGSEFVIKEVDHLPYENKVPPILIFTRGSKNISTTHQI